MKIDQVKEIANAVLYEGYLLYPYRHSAIKNRQRWTFGVVYPRAYSEANGNIEPWMMQTECLITGQAHTSLDIHIRFLHLLLRDVEASNRQPAAFLQPQHADGESHTDEEGMMGWTPEAWEEGIEREVSVPGISLSDLVAHPQSREFLFPAHRMVEPLADTPSTLIIREQQLLTGIIKLAATHIDDTLYKLSVQIENTTPTTDLLTSRRDGVLLLSFVSTHTILQVHQGNFISLLEPPQEQQTIAEECQNIRTWPVLVGKEGEHDVILSSPIILYDYPQIAPESAGSLFDGTEIDEILTLRIMTLTDEEKQEMRQGDARAREILERTESLTSEQLMKLHGTIRNLQPVNEGEEENMKETEMNGLPPSSVHIAGTDVKVGSCVRLHPSARADAFDMLLAGKTARVETIHQDFENRIYLVVTLDDDPGREQWDERVLPGHRFFFYPEEIEPLTPLEGVL